MFGLSDIRKFSRDLLYRSQYGITEDECVKSIQTACDFFGIPMPKAIENLTNDPEGATMFKNWDENRFDVMRIIALMPNQRYRKLIEIATFKNAAMKKLQPYCQ